MYIDEVNLLDDHVVDVLLDVAVSGVNVVMREGVTYRHPSRFLLVGTMNQEEGELRPQLLDRFGLCVEVSGEREVGLRKEIVSRVLSYEEGEASFFAEWEARDDALKRTVREARTNLPGIRVPDEVLHAVVEAVAELGVAGHRGDITILKTARALAAWRVITSYSIHYTKLYDGATSRSSRPQGRWRPGAETRRSPRPTSGRPFVSPFRTGSPGPG